MSNTNQTAIRGSLFYLHDDPFLNDPQECAVYESDGMIVMQDGKITAVGATSKIMDGLPEGVEVTHYPDAIIMPGFIDAHIHYPQVEIIGSYGEQLLEWLNKYTFPAEAKFNNPDHARKIAEFFVDELKRNGTTSASVYCTSAPESVDAIFGAAEQQNMLMIAGKMMMDCHALEAILDTPQSSYDDSKALIERWHKKGRALYTVSPRFALTSSREQLEMAATLYHETPDVLLQTHISENKAEIARALELFPEHENYTAIYDHYNLMGERAIYGHGIHLSEGELQRFYETGATIAHCPTSNFFIGSGLFDIRLTKQQPRPVRVGLGTDVGGGTSFSMLQTLAEAYKMAQMRGISVNAIQGFYLATLGSAHALYIDDRVGTFKAGMDADVIVLDPHATPLLQLRSQVAETIEEILFALMICGDDRTVSATYIAGNCVYERDK